MFDKTGDWKSVTQRQHTFRQEGKLAKNTYLILPMLDDEMLTIDAVNMDLDNWIFACTAVDENGKCESGINLSDKSVIMPSNGKRKSITLHLEELRQKFSHVVVYMSKGRLTIFGYL